MTTDKIRKQIHVLDYNLTDNGIEIKYVRYADACELGTKKTLVLNPEETARELSAIDSIDSWEVDTFLMNYENQKLHWLAFVLAFNLSQWEALTLVIKHEMEIELYKDSNFLEIDKALEALKNK